MYKLLACIHKELLLLWRDRAGMLVLFVMPAVLVLVITLVQENVLKIMGESTTRILLVDQDQQGLGQRIEEKLGASDKAIIVTELDGRELDEESALEQVAGGGYQACIIVPAGISKAIRRQAGEDLYESGDPDDLQAEALATPTLQVYFDPIVLGVF